MSANEDLITVSLSGCRGGHSGVDIHKEYANANKLLARIMMEALPSAARLTALKGGTGPSAIPREASCSVLVPSDELMQFFDAVDSSFKAAVAELASVESSIDLQVAACGQCGPSLPDISAPVVAGQSVTKTLKCSRCPKCQEKEALQGSTGPAQTVPALSAASTQRVWQFMSNMPHGVMRMSTDVPGLVESSVSFGIVELRDKHLFCHIFHRSSVNSYMKHAQRSFKAYGDLCGAENLGNICPFPAWQPRMSSTLVDLLKAGHGELCDGKEPKVYTIHAGLECGAFMESHPDLDCASIGPEIIGPHSPDERVNIKGSIEYLKWVQRTLEKMP